MFICGSYVCFLCHDLELQTGSFDWKLGEYGIKKKSMLKDTFSLQQVSGIIDYIQISSTNLLAPFPFGWDF